MATSRLDIDLSAVDHNLALVQSVLAPEGPKAGSGRMRVGVCAVLKQDGYGVGAIRLAKAVEAGSRSDIRIGPFPFALDFQ